MNRIPFPPQHVNLLSSSNSMLEQSSGYEVIDDDSTEELDEETGNNAATQPISSGANEDTYERWTKTERPRGRQPKDPHAEHVRFDCRDVDDLETNLRDYLEAPTASAEHAVIEFHFPVTAAFMVYTRDFKRDPSVPWTGPEVSDLMKKTAVSVAEVLQATENPKVQVVRQKAVARPIIEAIQRADKFKYSFNNNWLSREDQAHRFSFFCNDSTLNKGRAANGGVGTEGRKLRKAVYDCKGFIAIKFSVTKNNLEVHYKHVPIHKSYVDRAPVPRRESKRRRIMEITDPEGLAALLPKKRKKADTAEKAREKIKKKLGRPRKPDTEISEKYLRKRQKDQAPQRATVNENSHQDAGSLEGLQPLIDFVTLAERSIPAQNNTGNEDDGDDNNTTFVIVNGDGTTERSRPTPKRPVAKPSKSKRAERLLPGMMEGSMKSGSMNWTVTASRGGDEGQTSRQDSAHEQSGSLTNHTTDQNSGVKNGEPRCEEQHQETELEMLKRRLQETEDRLKRIESERKASEMPQQGALPPVPPYPYYPPHQHYPYPPPQYPYPPPPPVTHEQPVPRKAQKKSTRAGTFKQFQMPTKPRQGSATPSLSTSQNTVDRDTASHLSSESTARYSHAQGFTAQDAAPATPSRSAAPAEVIVRESPEGAQNAEVHSTHKAPEDISSRIEKPQNTPNEIPNQSPGSGIEGSGPPLASVVPVVGPNHDSNSTPAGLTEQTHTASASSHSARSPATARPQSQPSSGQMPQSAFNLVFDHFPSNTASNNEAHMRGLFGKALAAMTQSETPTADAAPPSKGRSSFRVLLNQEASGPKTAKPGKTSRDNGSNSITPMAPASGQEPTPTIGTPQAPYPQYPYPPPPNYPHPYLPPQYSPGPRHGLFYPPPGYPPYPPHGYSNHQPPNHGYPPRIQPPASYPPYPHYPPNPAYHPQMGPPPPPPARPPPTSETEEQRVAREQKEKAENEGAPAWAAQLREAMTGYAKNTPQSASRENSNDHNDIAQSARDDIEHEVTATSGGRRNEVGDRSTETNASTSSADLTSRTSQETGSTTPSAEGVRGNGGDAGSRQGS